MDVESIIKLMQQKTFRKLTGPPEHWLTTLNTKFWGLESKHRARWIKIKPGDLCVFHSTGIQYLSVKLKIPTGIIGVGIVGAIGEKTSLEWIVEIWNNENRWPLLIYFSEIWWFGDISSIRDIPIMHRIPGGQLDFIFEDIEALVNNCVTFGEMKQEGFSIFAQGSIQNIDNSKRDKLVKLIATRLKGPVINPIEIRDLAEHETYELNNEDDLIANLSRQAYPLSVINLNETDEEAKSRAKKLIQYMLNQEAQDKANKSHRLLVNLMSGKIKEGRLKPKQSKVIDLIAENRKKEAFIFEMKSVQTDNFTYQTRAAIGQLLYYEYFQIKRRRTTSHKILS